jgi:hypothetical protein
MLARESWLAGSIFWSSSPGNGRLEGREMVVILGMMAVYSIEDVVFWKVAPTCTAIRSVRSLSLTSTCVSCLPKQNGSRTLPPKCHSGSWGTSQCPIRFPKILLRPTTIRPFGYAPRRPHSLQSSLLSSPHSLPFFPRRRPRSHVRVLG